MLSETTPVMSHQANSKTPLNSIPGPLNNS